MRTQSVLSAILLAAIIVPAPLICRSAGGDDSGAPAAGELTRGMRYASLADPMVGTGGHGHTYPGATVPFGMVQLSPDTRLTGWDGCSAYHHSDRYIYGFSHTHLSGTGCSDYGDILLMPFPLAGGQEPPLENGSSGRGGYRSSFSHARESSAPGYYTVFLEGHGIDVGLTATRRCGFHRYVYPEGRTASVVIDLEHRDEVIDSGMSLSGPSEVSGFRRSREWAQDQRLFFVARFSRPVGSHRFASGTPGPAGMKGWFTFDTGPDRVLLVKVGISAVSIEGARKNLEAEIPGWDFDGAAGDAVALWEEALGRIRVSGGSESRRRTFYTALYHTMLAPNLYSDVDGMYRGRDLKVHRAEGFEYYTVFSLWDTYRAAHPLFTILEPDRTVDFIRTFLAQYLQGGLLPVWELSANETDCMIGHHAVSVIADAYAKGIRGFDAELALEAMMASALQDRFGLKAYSEYGYIPSEEAGQSVSRTLEYAYDDWCIARMAGMLGRQREEAAFLARAQGYKHLFDPSTGFMRARLNGGWVTPFDPSEVNFHYTEANSWQYSFYVPHDISGLARLHGGMDKLEARLDSLFSDDSGLAGLDQPDVTGLIGQYAHGNEPSHHMAYLYNFTGSPSKTQARVREIIDTMYSDRPDGLCGNEDCGQMSAWYVFSAMGFYPVTPGSDRYVIGIPAFDKVEISLGEGRSFTVIAPGAGGPGGLITAATLNGKPHPRSWISHSDIVSGGSLVFELGPAPSGWGRGPADLPVTGIEGVRVCPAPYLDPAPRTFTGQTAVSLACAEAAATIRYTLDGSLPGEGAALYERPLEISESAVLTARAFADGMLPSGPARAVMRRIDPGVTVSLTSPCSSMYDGGGDLALVDGIRGGRDFRTGGWQGFRGVDLEAVVDLGSERPVEAVSAGFLHDQGAWIFLPRRVEFAVSSDGGEFEVVCVSTPPLGDREGDAAVWEAGSGDIGRRARFIRLRAESIGECPAWHPGSGGRAWIFVDEITVE